MLRTFLGLAILIFSVKLLAAPSYNFFDKVYDVEHERLLTKVNIKVGVMTSSAAKANLIYLHGFADTMDNHERLLNKFRDSGMNVIAYDYPSHGDSGGHIWTWDMKEVAMIINTIMNDSNVKFDRSLPVILAGWSTGATMAIRIMQEPTVAGKSWKDDVLPNSQVIGLVLYAPSVPANVMVGSSWLPIFPQLDSLTRNKSCLRNDPQPVATVAAGEFVGSLKLQSELARSPLMKLPKDLPILTIIAGDNDLYTTSSNTVNFVKAQAAKGVQIVGFQCTGSYHAIMCEPDQIGLTANGIASTFATAVAINPARRVEKAQSFKSLNSSTCPRVK